MQGYCLGVSSGLSSSAKKPEYLHFWQRYLVGRIHPSSGVRDRLSISPQFGQSNGPWSPRRIDLRTSRIAGKDLDSLVKFYACLRETIADKHLLDFVSVISLKNDRIVF